MTLKPGVYYHITTDQLALVPNEPWWVAIYFQLFNDLVYLGEFDE